LLWKQCLLPRLWWSHNLCPEKFVYLEGYSHFDPYATRHVFYSSTNALLFSSLLSMNEISYCSPAYCPHSTPIHPLIPYCSPAYCVGSTPIHPLIPYCSPAYCVGSTPIHPLILLLFSSLLSTNWHYVYYFLRFTI